MRSVRSLVSCGDAARLVRFLYTLTRASSTSSGDAFVSARDVLERAEREQKQREDLIDSRSVLFASACSSDNRPRVAAAEAFDIARAALPRPPNFCYMNVTLDYSAMLDAPEVVWAQLVAAHGKTLSTVKAGSLHMLAAAVHHQRVGGSGFIQVMLGCVPDLAMDVFTFDAPPTHEMVHGNTNAPKPFACIANVDAKLMLQHEATLSRHVQDLATTLGHDCPLFGAVLPPVAGAGSGHQRKVASTREELEDSIFFINDRVYRGSAAGAVLRSDHIRAHRVSVVPSIAVRSDVRLGGVTLPAEPGRPVTIETLGGVPATEYIKEVYHTEAVKETAKVFVGLPAVDSRSGKQHVIPVTFFANPKESTSILILPPSDVDVGAVLKNGASVSLVVDDVELDSEAGAGELLALQSRLKPAHVVKDIGVAREGRRSVVVSSCAGIHFSHRLMNVAAERSDQSVALMGGWATISQAPSVMQRVVGQAMSSGGVYTPGQLVTLGDATFVAARASSYTVLEGLS